MYTDLTTLCVSPGSSILDAIRSMDHNRLGIALVVDSEKHLIGTITDGDVRRAMLARTDLSTQVDGLLAQKAGTAFERPVTASATADAEMMLKLLQINKLFHLPLLDDRRRVVGLVTLEDFTPHRSLPLQAVIMAGGQGSRLYPLTIETPKPMLPVGDRPLMAIMIEQMREAGIKRVNVSTHHKHEKISDHFGNGESYGVDISYVTEDRPLGTAGALGLMGVPDETVLVVNGDILTQVDFRHMLAFHREHRADLTMAVRYHEMRLPYGVVDSEGSSVFGLREKPVVGFLVNAGMYLLEPDVYKYIPSGEHFDMTDLIQRLLEEGRPISSFPIREYWLDIGDPAEYERAQNDVLRWKTRSQAKDV